MKILHTADLHLDRAFEGLGKMPAALSEELAKANQKVMRRIVDAALSEKVDLVLIVGDTFHQTRMSIQVQAFFTEQLQRLDQADIPVVLVFGNHDFVQPNRFWFSLPKNVKVLENERVETVTFVTKKGEKVAVSGFSYHHPHLSKNLLLEFPVRYSEVDYHIGLYHGEILRNNNDSFAPFKLNEMKEKGYDYWALGHIHKPTILHQNHPLIAYSGAPQGHTRKEEESTGILITELSKQGTQIRTVSCAEVWWKKMVIDIAAVEQLNQLLPMIEKKIVSQPFAREKKIYLVQIKLAKAAESFMAEIEEKMKNDEILYRLQESVYQKTEGRLWLYDLQWEPMQEELILPFGLNDELVEQLTAPYKEKEPFIEVINPLLQQKEIARKWHFDADQRSEIVERALQSLLQEMGISREDR